MIFETVIQGGTIYNAGSTIRADLAIMGERIAAVGLGLQGQQTIDASGMYLFPGAIDGHVHFQLPLCGTISADDFENGTKAAACGGVTTVLDFAVQQKGGSLQAAIDARRAEADGKVCIDYGLHVGITDWNYQIADEFRRVIDQGIPTFKMFMIYKEQGLYADDASLYQALQLASETGAQIGVHAESLDLLEFLVAKYRNDPEREKYGAYAHALSRPAVVEWEAVQRAISWAEVTGGRLYIVHTSTGRAAQLVGQARQRGVNVYCETCPQYLLLDEEVFKGPNGHLYATCPQIKTKQDAAMLWQGLSQDWVHVLATDTCTFTTNQKAMWQGEFWKIPYGLPGVETLVPLTYTFGPAAGKFSINHWIKLVAENPARLFGLYPRKGVLQPGSDADIVIWDPQREFLITPANLQTNCDWSPYEGLRTKGYPHLTISRGRIVARAGKFVGKVGAGQYLERAPGPGLTI